MHLIIPKVVISKEDKFFNEEKIMKIYEEKKLNSKLIKTHIF